MKHKIVEKVLLFITPVCGTTPIVLINTSCGHALNSVKKINGSDWVGAFRGAYFDPSEYLIDDDKQTITYNSSFTFKGKNVVLPNYVKYHNKKYKVLLGDNCFMDNYSIIDSFELNDFIETIPPQCFLNTAGLNKIIFHKYPTYISDYAFTGSILSEVVVKQGQTFDQNWTTKLQYIGKEAFKDLPGLQGHLTFGSQLQSLGEGVFAGCSGLNGVDFRFCENEQMTDIPDNAFYSCFLLKDVALPPNLASIGKDAFNECRLIDKIELPRDNMEFSLGVGTFSHCYSLINFSKPCTITSIGDNCFSGDTSLSQSFVPWKKGGLQTIAKDAFAQTNYSVLTFYSGYPSEVLDNAFDECSLLGNIDFSQYDSIEPPQWTGINIFANVPETGTIVLPEGAVIQDWMKLFVTNEQGKIVWKQGIIVDQHHWQFKTIK